MLAVAATALVAQGSPHQYEVVIPDAIEAELDAPETVSLTIAATPGYEISHDGPLRVELTIAPASGVKLPKRRYVRDDAADARADNPRFDLRFTASEPGDYRLGVDARFWVCTRRTCRPVREKREVSIRATRPTPPGDAGAEPDGGL